MPDHEVKWTESSVKALEDLDGVDSVRILEKMETVSKTPFHYVKRLKGVPLYSLRIRKYRVIMSIEKEHLVILIVDIGNTENVYDNL